MSENIKQIYDADPQTTNQPDDLMYLGRSPYSSTDNKAIKYSDFNAQIITARGLLTYLCVSSTAGVDAAGRGSVLKPYATIGYALSQITDNTITKQYFLDCYGIFSETNLALKPFVNLEGNGSKLSVSGVLSQSADWASLSNGFILFNNFEIAIASVTFQIASMTGGKVIFSNLYNTLTSAWLFQANDTVELTLNNIGNPDFASSKIMFTIFNFLAGSIKNCYLDQLIMFANFYGNQNYSTSGNVISGAYEINAENGFSGDFYIDDTFMAGAILGISAPDSGTANVRVKSASQITDIRLDGANVNFIPDLLSVTPTFSGGASDANIKYPSLSNSMTAGFTPANYSVVNPRVESHLMGIDDKFANLGTPTSLVLTNATGDQLGNTAGTDAAAFHVREYLSVSIPQGSPIPLTTNVAANVTSQLLTAGDWVVSGVIYFLPGAATVLTKILSAISGTSATVPTLASDNNVSFLALPFTTGELQSLTVGPRRVSISTPTTIFLVAQATFTIDTLSAFGFIGFRRV